MRPLWGTLNGAKISVYVQCSGVPLSNTHKLYVKKHYKCVCIRALLRNSCICACRRCLALIRHSTCTVLKHKMLLRFMNLNNWVHWFYWIYSAIYTLPQQRNDQWPIQLLRRHTHTQMRGNSFWKILSGKFQESFYCSLCDCSQNSLNVSIIMNICLLYAYI